jgi:hypothetical protein
MENDSNVDGQPTDDVTNFVTSEYTVETAGLYVNAMR